MPVKIFVGNVSKSATKEELEALFARYGNITECSILNNFAFVHMSDEAGATAAINDLNASVFAGQPISVQRSKGVSTPKGKSPSHTPSRRPRGGNPDRNPRIPKRVGLTKIFVGNIKDGTESGDLRVLFEAYGEVAEADVCGGYGFVHMPNQKEALKAISELRGYSLCGKVLNVELSTVNTQGRSRFGDDEGGYEGDFSGGWDDGYGGPVRSSMSGGMRYDPYKLQAPPRKMGMRGPMGRMPGRGGMFGMNLNGSRFPPPPRSHFMPPPPRLPRKPQPPSGDSFARELLELYLRDPEAFDRYAKDPMVQRSLNLNFFEGESEGGEGQGEEESPEGGFFTPPGNFFPPASLNEPSADTAPVMYPNLPPPGVLSSGQSFRPPPPPFPRPRFPGPPSAGYTSFE